MEDLLEFSTKLEPILQQKTQELDRVLLPRLHENFGIYHKSVQSIFNVLVRKSLLQEDPYKYEQKISEVTVPDTSPILESEKSMQIGIRLSNFDSQLEFLNHYYQFSVEFLDMKRIKNLAALALYIKWDKSSITTSDPNSAILNEFIGKIQNDSDPVSFGILKSARQELVEKTRLILRDLKELTAFHKESYKQEIRREILPSLGVDEKQVAMQPEKIVKLIKRKYAEVFPGKPVYGDLIQEVLDELYSPQAEILQRDLYSRLKVKESKSEKKEEQTYRRLLMESLKHLGGSGTYLEQCLSKFKANTVILETKKESLGEKLRKWLASLVSKDKSGMIMELEIFEEETSLSKTVRIDYSAFQEKTVKQARLLSALTMEVSQLYQKLNSSPEEAVFKFLSEKMTDLQKTCEILPAVATWFKSEASRDQRTRLAGIEKELESIKGCINRANKKRFEYASRIEELEQLRRLGVDKNR